MKIITSNIMTCKTCDTIFEYDANELIRNPMYPCMAFLNCPRCGQQIIMIADDFKEVTKPIVIEEANDEEIS